MSHLSGFAVKAGGDTRVSSDEAQRLGRDLAPPVRDGENGSPVESAAEIRFASEHATAQSM